jgi:hypothetical protein
MVQGPTRVRAGCRSFNARRERQMRDCSRRASASRTRTSRTHQNAPRPHATAVRYLRSAEEISSETSSSTRVNCGAGMRGTRRSATRSTTAHRARRPSAPGPVRRTIFKLNRMWSAAVSLEPILKSSVRPFSKLAFKAALAAEPG